MFLLSLYFVAVAAPYAAERLFFARRFGLFAVLFWLLIFQSGVLFAGEIILENHLDQSAPSWVNSVGLAIGTFAYLTIGLTPITVVIAALGFGTVIAAKWFLGKLGEDSD